MGNAELKHILCRKVALCPACNNPVGFDLHSSPESMAKALLQHEGQCIFLQALRLWIKQ